MLHSTRKVAAAAIGVSALALASTLPAADATNTVTNASHISIKGKGLDFSGKVTSSSAPCKGGRHVTLFRTLQGSGHQKLGSATTPASGKWHITVSGSAGISLSNFYATVKKSAYRTAGTIYVCKSARSKTIAFHP
jgi:hypothetical protein